MKHPKPATLLLVSIFALIAAALACNAPGANNPDPTADSGQIQVTLTHIINPTLLTPEPTDPPDATAEPEATPTEAPTPTGCGYWSQFVDDVTIPDGEEVPAGESFTKTWEIRNNGCLAWPPDMELVFIQGDQLDGPDTFDDLPSTAPGQTAEISVDLVAPQEPGTYKGYWQLIAPVQISVGPPVWVEITVVEADWQRFVGEWLNSDANTETVGRLEITASESQLVVHRFDVCGNDLCDVGTQTTSLDDAEDGILNLTWTGAEQADTEAYKSEIQLITALGDARLQVIGNVDFIDEEEEDFTYTEFFAESSSE